jgi:hypothetical protein
MRKEQQHMKLKRAVIVGLAVCGVVAGVAVATPGLLVTATTPIRGTIAKPVKVDVKGLVRLKTKGPMEVADQVLTLQPGGHTGWHTHPGPVLVVIKSGTFTLYNAYDAECKGQVFEAGSAFVDPGNGYVHIGRNEGTTPVELSATYLLPVGAGPRIDVAPAPGNCPF